MIVIVGSQYRTRKNPDGIPEVHYCQSCGQMERFIPGETRRWLTLFFLPVVPTDPPRPVLVCEQCGAERLVNP